jgi:tetratricopeptide (TPR) repeat protein
MSENVQGQRAMRELHQIRLELERTAPDAPDWPVLIRDLAKTLEQQGFLQEALSAYVQFTEKASKADDVTYKTFCEMGTISQKLGNFDDASRYFRDAATLNPNDRKALAGWAESLSLQRCSDEEIARQLLASKGDLGLIAEALAEIGAYGEALKLLPMEPALSFRDAKLRCLCLMKTNRLQEASEQLDILLSQADEPALPPLVIDRVLCLWGGKQSIPGDLYDALMPEHGQHIQRMDRYLTKGGAKPDPVPIPLAGRLIDRAVELRLLPVAGALSRLDAQLHRVYAKSLYMHGFGKLAEIYFQQWMEHGQPDDEELFMLAELHYDNGKYEQAAVLFEQAAAGSRQFHKSLLAASLCYLEIAQAALRECMLRNPDHPVLSKEMQRIQKSKLHFVGVEWRTARNGAQRRNAYVVENNFTMHDRQE